MSIFGGGSSSTQITPPDVPTAPNAPAFGSSLINKPTKISSPSQYGFISLLNAPSNNSASSGKNTLLGQ